MLPTRPVALAMSCHAAASGRLALGTWTSAARMSSAPSRVDTLLQILPSLNHSASSLQVWPQRLISVPSGKSCRFDRVQGYRTDQHEKAQTESCPDGDRQ